MGSFEKLYLSYNVSGISVANYGKLLIWYAQTVRCVSFLPCVEWLTLINITLDTVLGTSFPQSLPRSNGLPPIWYRVSRMLRGPFNFLELGYFSIKTSSGVSNRNKTIPTTIKVCLETYLVRPILISKDTKNKGIS